MDCNNCLHIAVCDKYQATGGHVRNCKHFATDNNVGSKWIPVSERLPEVECYTYSTDVLFCEYEEGIHVGYVCFETGAWKDRYSRDIYADYKVTHWMPLPEPPKEDE